MHQASDAPLFTLHHQTRWLGWGLINVNLSQETRCVRQLTIQFHFYLCNSFLKFPLINVEFRCTCSLISFIFSTFFSFVAYSWTSFNPISVHSRTKKRRPAPKTHTHARTHFHCLYTDQDTICCWSRVLLKTVTSRMNYIPHFLETFDGCLYKFPALSGSFL